MSDAREPCGAFMGWAGDDGQPCGRPQGHSSFGGCVSGGHNYDPLPEDPPTKKFVRRVIWQVEK